MKSISFIVISIFILLSGCKKAEKGIPFASEKFSVYPDKVVQGSFEAVVISPTEVSSNYRSPARDNYSRIAEFKFSLNGKDNEFLPGLNRKVLLLPENGKVESELMVFGQLGEKRDFEEPKDFLGPNIDFLVKLDMRLVLAAFEKDGFYVDVKGEKLAKSDFKGVYIAGSSAPLSWDFENLANTPEFELKDPDGDGIYETTVKLNAYDPNSITLKNWTQSQDVSAYPSLKSQIPIVEAMYNLALDETVMNTEADSTFRTGAKWPGVWTRDISYSVHLAYAIVAPQLSRNSLMRKVRNNRIIQDTGSGGAWPVSTDRNTWAIAAWEIYLVTGDRDWLLQAYTIIRNSVEDDLNVINSPKTGLMRGESSFLDWRKQTYPLWMDNVDIFTSENLGTNAVHFRTYEILSEMGGILGKPEQHFLDKANKIKKAIKEELWLKDEGYFAQYLYGKYYMNKSPRAEALGESLCMLFGIADNKESHKILCNTPLTPFGITSIYPQIPGIPPYHNDGIWPFVQAYWNWAAARMGHESALSHGLGSIYRAEALFLTNKENFVAENGDFLGTEINSDRQLWSVAGSLAMIYRVFLGMEFHPDHLSFNPVIPWAYGEKLVLDNFRYRNAILKITVIGHGNKIKSFSLDGNVLEDNKIEGNLEGKHEIKIVLDDNPMNKASANFVENKFSCGTPQIRIENQIVSWDSLACAVSYLVYLNGEPEKVEGLSYKLQNDKKAIQVKVSAIDENGFESFTSEPVLLPGEYPKQIVEMEQYAAPSREKFINFSGRGFVEVSKTKNQTIKMKIDVLKSGNYLLDFRYSNGSGPWNTDNKCAIRSLFRDGQLVSPIVMAQRGLDEWSNWGYSNPIAVKLKMGVNELEIGFPAYNENMNGEVNRAMMDHARLILLD